MNKLYLLKRISATEEYDSTLAMVVCAFHPREARLLADAATRGYNDERVFINALMSSCKEIGIANKSIPTGIICTDFKAG